MMPVSSPPKKLFIIPEFEDFQVIASENIADDIKDIRAKFGVVGKGDFYEYTLTEKLETKESEYD